MRLNGIIKALPTLYRPTAKGDRLLYWRMEYSGNRIRSCSGVVEGKEKVGAWTVVYGTNVGRSNTRDGIEQAESVARSHFTKKKKRGYLETGEKAHKRLSCMLAQTYEKGITSLEFPVFVQPKLNGVRCQVSIDGMFTRNGEPITSCPHVFEALKPALKNMTNSVFDGELYCHSLGEKLNRIMSLVRKVKATSSHRKLTAKAISYNIYDFYRLGMEKDPFECRHETLTSGTGIAKIMEEHECIRLVETVIAEDKKGLEGIHVGNLQSSYEGSMIRTFGGSYSPRRSKDLLKYKAWKDAEFRIVDIHSGKGKKAGEIAAKVECEHISGEWKGNKFFSNIVGDYPYLRHLYSNKAELVGTRVTVRYAYLTEYGKPFHPEAVTFWEGKTKI